MKFPESKCKSLFSMQNIEIKLLLALIAQWDAFKKKIENAKLQKCTWKIKKNLSFY